MNFQPNDRVRVVKKNLGSTNKIGTVCKRKKKTWLNRVTVQFDDGSFANFHHSALELLEPKSAEKKHLKEQIKHHKKMVAMLEKQLNKLG